MNVYPIFSSLKLDLYDKTAYKFTKDKNPVLNQESCLKPVYPIWFVTLQSFWSWVVFTCKDLDANKRTLLEEK